MATAKKVTKRTVKKVAPIVVEVEQAAEAAAEEREPLRLPRGLGGADKLTVVGTYSPKGAKNAAKWARLCAAIEEGWTVGELVAAVKAQPEVDGFVFDVAFVGYALRRGWVAAAAA